MAFNVPPYHKRTILVIRDMDGQPLMEFTTSKSRDMHNGVIEEIQSSESRPLVNGPLTHPGIMVGPDAQLPSICTLCQKPPRSLNPFKRERPTHGLCSPEGGTNCASCGRFACCKHLRPGRDGIWRCTSCSRKVWFRRFLFGWLWTEEE